MIMMSPVWAGMAGDGSAFPSRYEDYYEITAREGMLIGGEGDTGDSMRYRGKRVWSGPGTATVLVREDNNTGIVMGNVRVQGHTYTVMMDQFSGDRPFQSGGIATSVNLHGTSRRGAPIFPRTFAYLAGWGSPCTVWKDAHMMYGNFECHFMLTEAVRDPETGKISEFPNREKVQQLLAGQRDQGDYERNQTIRQEIRESGDAERSGLQLHLLAHSSMRNIEHLPPFETTMHFVWNKVQWRGGPQLDAKDRGPGGRSDEEISWTIRRELNTSAMIDPQDIDVKVTSGRVTLTGTTDSAIAKEHAYFSAWVPGVKSVRNKIQVDPKEQPSDQKLQRAITEAYALDPRVVHSRPHVKVKDGIVTLNGRVASRQAKRAAEEVAMQFKGVTEVRNRLKVDQSLPKGEADDLDAIVLFDSEPVAPGIAKEDWELERDIKRELTWSPFVDADNVDVTVRDGIAYLFGTVEDRDEMQAAIENAFEAGADRIENRMVIEQPEDSDRMG